MWILLLDMRWRVLDDGPGTSADSVAVAAPPAFRAPTFRLLLNVAVLGAHSCELLNFLRLLMPGIAANGCGRELGSVRRRSRRALEVNLPGWRWAAIK